MTRAFLAGPPGAPRADNVGGAAARACAYINTYPDEGAIAAAGIDVIAE